MRKVDGQLSMRAQRQWPGALVLCVAECAKEDWVLERPERESLGLGSSRSNAQNALFALLHAERGDRQ